MVTQRLFREEPQLTELAFNRLLAWLDDGVDSRGETYLEMRRRLVAYFDRRNRQSADELADETLNRIGRTLEHSEIATRPPARYCYVVAKFVLLEDFRRERRHIPLSEPRVAEAVQMRAARSVRPDPDFAVRTQRLDCLDSCLEQLKPVQRDLIVEYYRDSRRQKIERRRDLAGRLGITMNALGIRASRIRDTLLDCLERCGKGVRKI